MKFIAILTVLILLISCGVTSSKNKKSKQSIEVWNLTSHTFTTNTYTSTGLLDTSYETMLLYEMGMLIDTIKSIVVREYDHGKLINEKEFTLGKDGSKTLSNETIKQYDSEGNLLTEINLMDNSIRSKTTNEYNNKGQIVRSTNVAQRMNYNPADYILDSAVAHRNDKKHFEYDTTTSTNEYDTNGNCIYTTESDGKGTIQEISITQYTDGNPIHTTVTDAKGTVQKTSIIQYSGKEEIFSCEINPQGDTIAKLTFKHDGDLVKQIAEAKELNGVDTMWLDKGKVVKFIGHHGKMKSKDEITYNNKGDEIESISYK